MNIKACLTSSSSVTRQGSINSSIKNLNGTMVFYLIFSLILTEVQGFVLEFDDRVEKPSVKNF